MMAEVEVRKVVSRKTTNMKNRMVKNVALTEKYKFLSYWSAQTCSRIDLCSFGEILTVTSLEHQYKCSLSISVLVIDRTAH